MTNFLNTFKKHVSNIPGWRTKRKLLVIESDDWGSIRMPNNQVRKNLLKTGIIKKSNWFNYYDTLAKKDDLAALFEVLLKHKDRYGNPSLITPVTIVGNPDFEKIRESNFESYFFEPFSTTLERYYGDDNGIIKKWKEGKSLGIFKPQFHGREHLNVSEWMRALQNNHSATKTAFDHGMWGIVLKEGNSRNISSYQAAFDLNEPEDLKFHSSSIIEGLKCFESIFGYKAKFFVPPNGPFNNSLEKTAAKYGIQYISKSKIQLEPQGYGKHKRIYNKIGLKTDSGLTCITRNCVFEPSKKSKNNWVDSCLNDIKIAFRMRKPAVISTHRVNYIGALEESNRTRGLRQLDELLASIVKQWPEVEFITSDQLGDIITGKEINGQ